MTQSRKDTYEELILLGLTPFETWEKIEEMEFSEDEIETTQNKLWVLSLKKERQKSNFKED